MALHLGEVGEEDGHGMERVPVGNAVLAQLDARQQLGQDDEVQDDRGREQRVLARVVQHDRLAAAHEDLSAVLVHRALAVGDVGRVLDDDDVVRVLPGRVEQRI